MVFCPDALMWELTKGNSCFLKKRSGMTKRSGAVQFSTEPGNIKSLNKFKYSGLANSKVYDIAFTQDNKAQLVIKTASKAATQPKKAKAVIPMNRNDFRRVEKAIRKSTSDVFYRRDLEAAALGKWTKVCTANKRAKGLKKVVPCKKGRGSL
jgi:large subunit ribosomal protein L28e